ncbi:MAG: hypothetical protein U0514_03315 [Candidatus Andersenbacteria bacterium]
MPTPIVHLAVLTLAVARSTTVQKVNDVLRAAAVRPSYAVSSR